MKPGMPMSELSTVSEKVFIMGALPNLKKLKEMSRELDTFSKSSGFKTVCCVSFFLNLRK